MSTSPPRVDAVRLDENRVRLDTQSGLPMTLFANPRVHMDRAVMPQIGALSGVVESVRALDEVGFFGDRGLAEVSRVAFSADCHPGSGTPVGTSMSAVGMVFPRASGRDIGSGMRLLATDLTRDDFEALGPRLDARLRHVLFGGGRDIPLSEQTRAAILRDGPAGLLANPGSDGIWRRLDLARMRNELERHQDQCWATEDLWSFEDFVRGSGGTSRDAAIASLGGGKHFLEIQWVEDCFEPSTAYRWGMRKERLCVMVHTGSLDIGAAVGLHFETLARRLRPTGMRAPSHGYDPLPLVGPHARHGHTYLSAMGLAANFAAVNRLFLGELALQCLSSALGRDVTGRLVYDAAHNVAWSDGLETLHRKGSCPAELDPSHGLFPDGQPVIVPGSMGDASYVLRGLGSAESLASAPHGAGRKVARGDGRKMDPSELGRLRVVTKVDPARVRRDIAEELSRQLLEEAPGAYKSSLPALETCAGAGIASPVAALRPLLTCKG